MERAKESRNGQQPQQEQSKKISAFSDLFGDQKDSANSGGGVFHSVFSPPSSSSYRYSASKVGSVGSPSQASWMKVGNADTVEKTSTFSGVKNQDDINHGLHIEHLEEMEPSSLGSSLYYGGQDICVRSPTSRAVGNSNIFVKDDNPDDSYSGSSNTASRGNWWQGSLYY